MVAGNDKSNSGEGLPNPAAQDNTHRFSAPVPVHPDHGTVQPWSGPGAVGKSSENDAQVVPSSGLDPKPARRYSHRGRPKGSKNKSQEPLSDERIEQLRAAGRVRGEQLKRDTEHQRRAGLARAARGDMGEIGAKGRAVQTAQQQTYQDKPVRSSPPKAERKPKAPAPPTRQPRADKGQAVTTKKPTKPPAPPKEKKPPLTKEELSERGRKGQAAALARHPDLYKRAGAGSLRAQQAAKERKRLEAEQARANQTEHGQGPGQDSSNPPATTEPPRPKRRYKTKWERC